MKRSARFLAALVLVGGLSAAGPAFAGPTNSTGGASGPGYNAIPSNVSGNVPSIGFQATQTTEFGDEVTLSGKNRTLSTMSVLLSSWACETGAWEAGNCETTPGATFDVPLTFTIYDAGSMDVLATKTQTVAVAYRPSASAQCSDGQWYNVTDKTCYNGFPQTVTMAMPQVALTDDVIWSVKYDTYSTSGVSGPADSLNVGVFSFPNAPYSGTDVNADEAFVNGAMQGGWTGYRPLGAITTVK
jgi:hypothetical protein